MYYHEKLMLRKGVYGILHEEGSSFQEKVTYYNILKCHTVGISRLRYESVYKRTYR